MNIHTNHASDTNHPQLFHIFLRYTAFSVLGMLGLSGYILADTFFISQGLGAGGLAALNLAIPVYNFIHGIGLMLGIGAATKYSIYLSHGDRRHADVIFTNTLYLAAAFAIAFMTAGIFFSELITRLLGADEEIFRMTNTYLKVLLLFAPAFILNQLLIPFVRNDGAPQLSMAAMLGGSMSNIVLDYIFIFPMHLGIFGAVFATGLSPVISMCLLSYHIVTKRSHFRIIRTKLHGDLTMQTFSLGFPSLIAQLSSGIVMIAFNMMILKLAGNIGLAAYGVVANLALVMIAVFSGIEQGIQPLFSQFYGSGEWGKVLRVLRYAMITMVLIAAGIYAVIFLFAEPIADIFNNEQNPLLREIAAYGLRLYFTAGAFAGFNTILSVFFTSTENALPAHILSLLRGLVIILPMVFLFASLWGITGVWMAYPAAEFCVAAISLFLYRRNAIPPGGLYAS